MLTGPESSAVDRTPAGSGGSAAAGAWRRCIIALALMALLPLLMLTYVVSHYVSPTIPMTDPVRFWAVHVLVLFAMIGTVAGGYIICTIAWAVKTMLRLSGDAGLSAADRPRDELRALSAVVAEALHRQRTQAHELHTIKERLARAQDELTWTRERLRRASDRTVSLGGLADVATV